MRILLFAASLLLLVLDQVTKAAAYAGLRGNPRVLIPGVLELRYLENTGAAFGMLGGKQTLLILITAVLAASLTVALIRIPMRWHLLPLHIALTGLLGGALGNLLDRIRLHAVRDFIYVRLIDFPVFNVADICVTVSAALLVLFLLFRKEEDLYGDGTAPEEKRQ